MTVDKKIINIEVQISNAGDFKERSLYYLSKNFSNQLKKGQTYKDLQPTISINIVDFKLFDTEDYHSKFNMADIEHDIVLTDKFEMHYFELPKIGKTPDTTDRKKLWMQLINAESEVDLEMLEQTNVKEILDGVSVIRTFSADDKMRYLALKREKALRDELSALQNARMEGIKEGKLAGIKEGKIEGKKEGRDAIVLRMITRNRSDEDIIEITGITAKELKTLRNSI